MKSEYYLSEEHERSLGIVFVDDAKTINAYTQPLQAKIDSAARLLGVETKEIEVPKKGFLRHPLTNEQRDFVNTMLSVRIANDNILQQEDLKSITIVEEKEKMVELPTIFQKQGIDVSFSDTLFHPACGEWADTNRIWYMRETAAHKVAHVFGVANKLGMPAHVEDVFRPADVQRGLLLRRIVQVAQDYPDWSVDNVLKVSKSFTASVPGLAGHMMGAAIDARFKTIQEDALLGLAENELYELGNDYPEGSAIACIDNPYITGPQFVARQQFAHIMRMGGFKILGTEDWHASHGDRGLGFDGNAHAVKSIYGPIHSFDRETGEIDPWDSQRMDIPFLSPEMSARLVTLARQKKTEGTSSVFKESMEVINEFRSGRKVSVTAD